MPIYEFQCQVCQHIFAETMKMSDPAPQTCKACGKAPVTKIMSLTAFQLKGSGWYADGYSTPPAQKPTEGAKAEAAPAKSTGEAAASSASAAPAKPSPAKEAAPKKGD